MDINTTVEEIQDEISLAWQMDLEQGVKWLNEKAVQEFIDKYPSLSETLTNILEIDNESD